MTPVLLSGRQQDSAIPSKEFNSDGYLTANNVSTPTPWPVIEGFAPSLLRCVLSNVILHLPFKAFVYRGISNTALEVL
jgi:hypothetical protein